jgi:beta-N-acetylhexosaminidase
MRRAIGLLFALAAAALAANPSSKSSAVKPSFWDGQMQQETAAALVEAMSDREALGQVFMIGYKGEEPTPELLDWIRNRNLGGVKLFTRNVNTLEGLARSVRLLQEQAARTRLAIPLFIATDQEGGWVQHIRAGTSQTPGNIAIGAGGLPRDALLTGYYLGRELAALGINMNFAPDIDVYSNPSASIVGPRAFSSDPSLTSLLALAWFKGLARSGVISTAKHFPGHGEADLDSHGSLPVVDIDLQRLWDRELLPYRVLIREGLPAIMSAHLAYPRILGGLTPASRSPFFIEELLRRRMGFDGLVITDDMEMYGVLIGGQRLLDTPRACQEALAAGSDIILVSHTPETQEKTWERLEAQMGRDPVFRARVRASAVRVLRQKLRTFREARFPLYPVPTLAGAVPAPGASEFFAESAARGVTLVHEGLIPYAPRAGERVILVGQFPEFLAEGRRRFPGAGTVLFPAVPFYTARPEDLRDVPRAVQGYDTVIFCLANFSSLQVLQELRSQGARVIVISALSPVYLAEVPWVQTSLAVYGTGQASFRAGFAVLAGDFRPEGRLPIELAP